MYSESDSAWIEDLLNTNLPPSDESVQRLKGFLVKPMKDLEDFNSEILDLRNRLSELEHRRDETEKWVSRHKAILAPIRSIPEDVLGDIFYHCLPAHRNPIMISTECPLLLTRVCRRWRAVAMTSPRLWDRLDVNLTDDDTVPDLENAAAMVRNGQISLQGWQSAQSTSEKRRTTQILRRDYEAAKEWLLRSGTRPLSISVSIMSRYWYTVPYSERPPSIAMEFLSFLATLAPRLKDLELNTSQEVYEAFEQMVTVSEMTQLTCCRIKISVLFARSTSAEGHIPKFLEGPNLRQLSIVAGGQRIWRICDESLIVHWAKLTSISCLHPLSIADTIFLLDNSSNLVHYEGVISLPGPDTGANSPTVHRGTISLPSLLTLSITEYPRPRYLGNVYECIDAPNLQSIRYCNLSFSNPRESAVDSQVPNFPLLPLLCKSTELQKLWFQGHDLVKWDIGILLRSVPTLTHLGLGSQGRVNSGRPDFLSSSGQVYDSRGNPATELWSFDDFIVSQEGKPPLLPQLTSLTVLHTTARLSDDTLFDLIRSRLRAANGIAPLEHVKVLFDRQRERDIVEELNNHAEQVGVKINLDLTYRVPRPAHANSPDFGFDQPGGFGAPWQI